MSRLAAFALGAAVTAVAAALLLWRAPSGSDEAERFRQRAYEAEARIAELRDELARLAAEKERLLQTRLAEEARRLQARPEPESPPVSAESGPAPMPEPSDPRLDPAWDELVSGALRDRVQRRLGRELTPQQEQRLMEQLDAVRQAGIALDEEDTADPTARRRQGLTRSIVLLEADRAFRNELGIGLGEFMNELNEEGLVEDLGEPPAEAPDGAAEEIGGSAEAY